MLKHYIFTMAGPFSTIIFINNSLFNVYYAFNQPYCKGNPLTPLCFTPDPSPSDVPSTSDPSLAVHLVSRGITHLPRYNSSPAHPASGLALYRRPPTSHDIMRHTVTSRSPRGTSHLPLAFRSRPGCPATSQDTLLPLLPSHPWDIPRLPEIP